MYGIIVYFFYMSIEILIIVVKYKRSSSCEGKIIKNHLHDDFENKRYIYLIEYMDENGHRYLIRSRITNGGKDDKIGNKVKLIKFSFNGKMNVLEPMSLYISPLVRIILIGILVMGFLYW